MNCNSCNFEIGEKETVKECDVCGKHTHAFCLISRGEEKVCDLCYVKKAEERPGYSFELPEEIRRTYIEVYRKCPNKFKLEVLEGNAQPSRPYTQVGIDLHEIFEKALVDRSYQETDWWKDYNDIYLKQHIEQGLYADEKEQIAFMARAKACLNNFSLLLPSIPIPFKVEETLTFQVSEGLPKARFTMDAIIENENGGLDLIDWKTGKELVGKQLASDLQAPIYIHGVEQAYGRRVDSFTFYYLKEGKVRKFIRDEDGVFKCTVGKREYYIRLNEMIGELQGIFTQMKKGNFNIPRDTKGMYFTCKMCHLQEQGLCLGADNESWKQLTGAKI